MSRIRSRELESESVPTRALRDDASTSDKIGPHAVRRNKEAWPAPARVREADLSAEVRSLMGEDQIVVSDTAPTDTTKLWVDTSSLV